MDGGVYICVCICFTLYRHSGKYGKYDVHSVSGNADTISISSTVHVAGVIKMLLFASSSPTNVNLVWGFCQVM